LLDHLSSTPVEYANLAYNELVGSLLYIMRGTRPNIAFAIHVVSRHLKAWDNSHWNAVRRILRYLITTKDFCLCYSADGETKVMPYSDSDWAADVSDRKSINGYLTLYGGGAIMWGTKKQNHAVATSSTEAEYYALDEAAKNVIQLRSFLRGVKDKQLGPTTIWMDNQSAMAVAKNVSVSSKLRHVHIRYHHIKHLIQEGSIAVEFVPSADNIADLLTKSLGRVRFNYLRDKAGVRHYAD